MRKSLMSAAAAVLLALGGLAAASPAAAQTGPATIPAASNGGCPDEYTRGTSISPKKGQTNPDLCYADGKSPPMVAMKRTTSEPCPSGLRPDSSSSYFCTSKPEARSWSAENNLAKDTKLPKPSKGVRCPTGWASTTQLDSCYTTLDNPPATRLSKGKPCAAGEIEEWGTWCTGDLSGVTRANAEGHASADFNKVYMHLQSTGGDWQGMKCCVSPAASAWYAERGQYRTMRINGEDVPVDDNGNPVKGAGKAVASGSGGNESTTGDETPASQCTSGSSTGAAIGSAIGGDAGAALGSMLGGLGKKKKKKAGC